MVPLSIYIHIPFCRHRCSYCDFNTYAGLEHLLDGYVEALCREIQCILHAADRKLPIHSIYFGGGTPSILPISGFEKIFAELLRSFEFMVKTEITVEANPGTLSQGYIEDLTKLGINRLSIGMQSAVDEELSLLGREHLFQDVANSVQIARQVGLSNINLDLIFGIPNQTIDDWYATLNSALSLMPSHLSLYALTLEHGTRLFNLVDQGLLPAPDPDLAADMYEWASIDLAKAGYQQYEISNWAWKAEDGLSYPCTHNVQYWRNLPYLGLGAGAHGYANAIRTRNVLSPKVYIDRLSSSETISGWISYPQTPAALDFEVIDQDTEIKETMMMGLRLTQEGISRTSFHQRFGFSIEERYKTEIDKLIGLELVEWLPPEYDRLCITPRGRLLGNQVFIEFI